MSLEMDRRQFLKAAGVAAGGASEILNPTPAKSQEKAQDIDEEVPEVLVPQGEKNRMLFRTFTVRFNIRRALAENQSSYIVRTTPKMDSYEVGVDMDESRWFPGEPTFCVIRNPDANTFTLRGTHANQSWEYTISADGSATGSIPDEVNQNIRIVAGPNTPAYPYIGHDVTNTCDAPTS